MMKSMKFRIALAVLVCLLFILPSCGMNIDLRTYDPSDEQCEILFETYSYVKAIQAIGSYSGYSHSSGDDGSYIDVFFNCVYSDATLNGNVEYETDGSDYTLDIDIDITFTDGSTKTTYNTHMIENSSGFKSVWLDQRRYKVSAVNDYFAANTATT